MPPNSYPECKKCNNGALVPFQAPDGRNVYYCTNCGIKFTAYTDEPMIDNKPIFLDTAQYLMNDQTADETTSESITKMMETEPENIDGEADVNIETTLASEHEGGAEIASSVEAAEPTGEGEVLNTEEISEIENENEIVSEPEDSMNIENNEPIPLGPRSELSEPFPKQTEPKGDMDIPIAEDADSEIGQASAEESIESKDLDEPAEPSEINKDESTGETIDVDKDENENKETTSEVKDAEGNVEDSVEDEIKPSEPNSNTTEHSEIENNDIESVADQRENISETDQIQPRPEMDQDTQEPIDPSNLADQHQETSDSLLTQHSVETSEPVESEESDNIEKTETTPQEDSNPENDADAEPQTGPSDNHESSAAEPPPTSRDKDMDSEENQNRLQDLLREFELPVYKTEVENKIEIETPEDKVDNIEVYKKLIQKYKTQEDVVEEPDSES